MSKNGKGKKMLYIEDYKKFDCALQMYSGDISTIKEFYECMRKYWDHTESISKHLQNLISNIVFNGMEEVQKFMDEYINFYNKTGELLDIDDIITDDRRDTYIGELAEQIYDYTASKTDEELKKFKETLINCIEDMQNAVADIFDITEQELEEAARKLDQKQNCDNLYFFYIVADTILDKLNEPLETSRNTVISAVDLMIEYSCYLNKVRKAAYEELSKEGYEETKPQKPSRNDLCPCGSGKKYKKCCLLKN